MDYPNFSSSKMNSKPYRIIICGTDTDVGKTVVSSLLVQGLNAMYWKPIQSGLEGGGDTNRVCQLIKLPKERYLPEIYKFKSPVSPHWAAEKENLIIEPHHLQLPLLDENLIIETAGGVMVPLNREYLQIDQLKNWMMPIVLVGRSGLGTLNHTLLTIEALNKRKVPIMGLILNGPFHQDNPKTLEAFGGIPIIAELPTLENLSAEALTLEWKKQKLERKFKSLIRKYF